MHALKYLTEVFSKLSSKKKRNANTEKKRGGGGAFFFLNFKAQLVYVFNVFPSFICIWFFTNLLFNIYYFFWIKLKKKKDRVTIMSSNTEKLHLPLTRCGSFKHDWLFSFLLFLIGSRKNTKLKEKIERKNYVCKVGTQHLGGRICVKMGYYPP